MERIRGRGIHWRRGVRRGPSCVGSGSHSASFFCGACPHPCDLSLEGGDHLLGGTAGAAATNWGRGRGGGRNDGHGDGIARPAQLGRRVRIVAPGSCVVSGHARNGYQRTPRLPRAHLRRAQPGATRYHSNAEPCGALEPHASRSSAGKLRNSIFGPAPWQEGVGPLLPLDWVVPLVHRARNATSEVCGEALTMTTDAKA